MRKRVLATAAAFCAFATPAFPAEARILDFGTDATGNAVVTSYPDDGFAFTGSHLQIIDNVTPDPTLVRSDSGNYLLSSDGGTVTLRIGRGGFSLYGFSYAEGAIGAPPGTLTVVGYLMNGGTVTQTFGIDGIADGNGGAPDFQSVKVTGFSNLWQATFSAGGQAFSLDSVDAVPEPATWTMMLVGFGAIGFAARRQRRPLLARNA